MGRLYILGAILTGTCLHAQDYFSAPIPFSIYNLPIAFAVGDMHNDRTLDIVAVGRNETTQQGFIAIIFGKGDGSFISKTELSCGYYPVDVVVEDIDQNGLPDIVTVNAEAETISLFTNQGGGSFKLKDNIKMKGEPKNLCMGDFNKDGTKDIAILANGGKELQFFKGTGKAQFKYGSSLTLDEAAKDLQFGDYSQTGYEGLLILHENTSMVSLISPTEKSGKWSFQIAKIDMYTRPVFARLTDVDGDGLEDAVTLDSGSLKFVQCESNGLLLHQPVVIGLVPGSIAFEIGDFNRDRRNDLVVLNPLTAQVQLYINQSTAEASRTNSSNQTMVLCDRDDAKPKMVDVGMMSSFKHVNMSLFDGSGQLIRKYFDFDSGLPDGQFTLEWNGTDENDSEVPDGNYVFYYKLGSLIVIRPLRKP